MSNFLSNNLKDYLFHGIIGSGAFSACYKVSNKSNGFVSVWKTIDYGWMSWKDQEQLLKETSLLTDIKHQSIVKFYSYMNNKIMCNVCIQMEYCSGGTLMDFIKKKEKSKTIIEENFIWDVLFKILNSLKWLHLKLPNMKMIQWSVSTSDIFIEKGNVKLGGFYLNEKLYGSYDISVDVPSSSRLLYTSPEVLTGEKPSPKSAVWSLGCVIHELSTFFPPFYGTRPTELISNITNFTRIKISTVYCRELQKIIDAMLETNPSMRPNPDELQRHPAIIAVSALRAGKIADKENVQPTCKKMKRKKDCNKCVHLELELNKMRHKEAVLNLKECRLKERELSLARREMKVSHLEKVRNVGRMMNVLNLDESIASGDVTDVGVTSTKLNPVDVKRPNFAKKNVHFMDGFDNAKCGRNNSGVSEMHKSKNSEVAGGNARTYLETHFI